MKELDKTYFLPGDLVIVKKFNDVGLKSPVMLVVGKVSTIIRSKDSTSKDNLIGIKCRWFTDSWQIQESIFNTKDLMKYE